MNNNMIGIKIGKLPGRIEVLALEDNKDNVVSTALEVAELNPEGYEIRVNGSPSEMDSVLENGDTVLLVKKIEGNI